MVWCRTLQQLLLEALVRKKHLLTVRQSHTIEHAQYTSKYLHKAVAILVSALWAAVQVYEGAQYCVLAPATSDMAAPQV